MIAAALLAVACSSPDTEARVDPDPFGARTASFAAVAPMLVRRCGSIDCHGSTFRNFRLYGYGGARLAAGHRPDFPVSVEPAEVQANYDAVIGLEPEIIRDVVNAGGAGYERLTLVRKGRNAEDHTGGQRMAPGDDADVCLSSWLANATRVDLCNRAGCVADGGILQGCEP
jgi:hypothetical protein